MQDRPVATRKFLIVIPLINHALKIVKGYTINLHTCVEHAVKVEQELLIGSQRALMLHLLNFV